MKKVFLVAAAGLAMTQVVGGATLDRTVVISNAMQPINAETQGGQPIEFAFSNLPTLLTGMVTITVSGEADVDGIDDAAGWIPAGDGFMEILVPTMEGLSLAFNGSVNFADLGLMKQAFFSVPGPSGQPNACSQ